MLRIYAKEHSLQVNALPPLYMKSYTGEWRRAGDLDTTGGAPTIVSDTGLKKVNSKWCQNPQFHIELADKYGQHELHLKITLKRSDKAIAGQALSKVPAAPLGGEKQEATVGLVVCKATVVEDKSAVAARRGKPRENALGEVSCSALLH